jgi:hypothetical protein
VTYLRRIGAKIPRDHRNKEILGRGRGPYTLKSPYCMHHGDKADHHTKDCPIYLDTKRKLDHELAQPSHQSAPREVTTRCSGLPTTNNILPPILLFFSSQTYQNSHTQTPAYYQSYHYATTNRPQHSQSLQITYPQPSPAPQITYPPAPPQITYPTP